MRIAVALIGVLAAAALLLVSMLMNLRFGLSLGQSDLDKTAYAGASVAGDLIKIIAPFWIGWAWREGRYVTLCIGALLFVVTLGYSVASGLGFAAQNRAATTGERAAEIVSYTDKRQERDRLLKRLAALPPSPPPEAVEARLEALRGQFRWNSSSRCTNATVPASIAFCARYREAEALLAAARGRAALEAEIDALSERIAAATTATAVRGDADPQVTMLLRILPILEANSAELGLAIAAMALVELGATFGFLLSVAHLGPVDVRRSEPAPGLVAPAAAPPPDDHVTRWGLERLRIDPAGVLSLAAAMHDYEQWCSRQGYRPLADIRPALQTEGIVFEVAAAPGEKQLGPLLRGVSLKAFERHGRRPKPGSTETQTSANGR